MHLPVNLSFPVTKQMKLRYHQELSPWFQSPWKRLGNKPSMYLLFLERRHVEAQGCWRPLYVTGLPHGRAGSSTEGLGPRWRGFWLLSVLDREKRQDALQPLEGLISSSNEPEQLWPVLSTHWCGIGHSASLRFSACEYLEQILQEPVANNWRGYQTCIHQAKVTPRKCVACWYLSDCRLVHIIYGDISCCAN